MSDEEVELVECGPPRDEEACDVDEICWYQNQQDKSNNSTMYCQPQVFCDPKGYKNFCGDMNMVCAKQETGAGGAPPVRLLCGISLSFFAHPTFG